MGLSERAGAAVVMRQNLAAHRFAAGPQRAWYEVGTRPRQTSLLLDCARGRGLQGVVGALDVIGAVVGVRAEEVMPLDGGSRQAPGAQLVDVGQGGGEGQGGDAGGGGGGDLAPGGREPSPGRGETGAVSRLAREGFSA